MTPAADLSACACACHSSYNETVLRYFGRRRRREAEAVQFGLIIAYQPQRASRPRATRQSLAISCSGCRSRDALRNIGFGYAAPAKKTAATNSGMSCARVMRVVIARHQPLHRPGWRTRREGPGSQCAEQLQSRPGPLCETAPTRSGGASPLLPAQIQNEAANKRSPGRCPPRLPAA